MKIKSQPEVVETTSFKGYSMSSTHVFRSSNSMYSFSQNYLN